MCCTSEELKRLLHRALPVLRSHVAADATSLAIHLLRDGSRCVVARCDFTSAETEVRSVILKQAKQGTSPDRFFADWASLAFLSQRSACRGIAPYLYGGDVGARLIAMEDLGGSRTLEDVLVGADLATAQRALNNLSTVTARLHAGTMGAAEEFDSLCRSLPHGMESDRHREAERWLADSEAIRHWLQAVGCGSPPGLVAACSHTAGLYAEPGAFLAFTHGDPAPTNNHLAGDQVRLVDFEYGGYRHALYDLTAWYVLCPLPEALVEEMSRRYRAELSTLCDAARDEDAFREAWAALCGYRALAMLSWIPRQVLTEDQSWVGEWTGRQAVLSTVNRLAKVAASSRPLEPLAEAALRLERALGSRWPGTVTLQPCWQALRGSAADPAPRCTLPASHSSP